MVREGAREMTQGRCLCRKAEPKQGSEAGDGKGKGKGAVNGKDSAEDKAKAVEKGRGKGKTKNKRAEEEEKEDSKASIAQGALKDAEGFMARLRASATCLPTRTPQNEVSPLLLLESMRESVRGSGAAVDGGGPCGCQGSEAGGV